MLDFDSLIDDDEEANAKFFLARGRAFACLSMFPEAVKDLTAAISMDEELLEAYLARGKCAYLLGDTALAFLDFQKLILIEPKNPMVHVYAGNLLMTTGSYDDATKAFSNADSVRKCPLAIYQRARCHVALQQVDNALADLVRVLEQSPHDRIAYIDKECLQAVKHAIAGAKAGSDGQPHYEKGIQKLTKLIASVSEEEKKWKSASTNATRAHA